MGYFQWTLKMMGCFELVVAGLVILLNAFLIYVASTSNQTTPCYIYFVLYFYNAITPLIIALHGWKCTSIAAIPSGRQHRTLRLRSMLWLPIIGTVYPLAVNGLSGLSYSLYYFRVIGDFRCFPALFSNTRDPTCDNEVTTYTLLSNEWTGLNILKWLVYVIYNACASWLLIFSAATIWAIATEGDTGGNRPRKTLFGSDMTGRVLQWLLGAFVFITVTGLFHLIPLACSIKAIFGVPAALGVLGVLVCELREVREDKTDDKQKTAFLASDPAPA